ncbi:hypothetical protein GQ43DRAFT_365036, partial [Delitschia confertaspora ATCC 74209]
KKDNDTDRFLAEAKVLKGLRHRHLMTLVGSHTSNPTPKARVLIMFPIPEQDLGTYLQQWKGLNQQELETYFGCLASVLWYLHHRNICHTSVAVKNIVRAHEGNVLCTGFSLRWNLNSPIQS